MRKDDNATYFTPKITIGELRCSECITGKMICDGTCNLFNPLEYVHRCNSCDAVQLVAGHMYPGLLK